MKILVIDGKEVSYERVEREGGEISVTLRGETYTFIRREIERKGLRWAQDPRWNQSMVHLQLGSRSHFVAEKFHGSGDGDCTGDGVHRSPMPGKILKVFVQEGEKVTRGQPLLILEAMKMEHTILSEREGKIKTVERREGEQVESDAVLMEITPL